MRARITTATLAALTIVVAACGGDEAGSGTTDVSISAPAATSAPPTTDTASTTTSSTPVTTSSAPGTTVPTTAGPTTLNLAATPGWEAIAEPFIAAVDEDSAGDVVIDIDFEWQDAHIGPNDIEQQIVRAVASGELALGLIGTRAFNELGVTDFDALTAPFLIDSYALQEAVFSSGIPDRMLEGVEQLGVTGLTVAAGPLRRLLGVDKPMVRVEDFAGATLHTVRSPTHAATASALGAAHTDVFGPERDAAIDDGTIDATENALQWVLLSGRTSYATLNAALWPGTGVLVANPGALGNLTPAQLDTVRKAAACSFATPAALAESDAALVGELCGAGKRVAHASSDDLARLRRAVQPVHDVLAKDPVTAGYLDEIEALESTVHADAITIPDGCTGAASQPDAAVAAGTDDPSVLNGSYRLEWTAEELVTATGIDERTARGNAGGFTLTLRDGAFDQTWDQRPGYTCPGTYAVTGGRITMVASADLAEWKCGGDTLGLHLVDAAWELSREQLILSDFVRSDEIDITWWNAVFLGKPLTRVD